ncbi:hypothetical protein [Flaviaesturariibacter aridisoli]|uniref:hypothetical protein n=1 Tax=Flaviaesturariibacter aridisoli TaxID=2545761 RepID=UPI001A9E77A4|nr:hypothetical protein [Flaviaesturariibacter aridisoli]
MNVKRTFGVILTILGIAGLIYAAVVFMDAKGTSAQIKTLIVYGLLGAIFFFTGIGLIRGTADDARSAVGGTDRTVHRETRTYRTDTDV